MGRPNVYPWDEWLRPGNTVELIYGKHYTCSHASMTLMCRQRAWKRGIKISIGNNKSGNGLILHVPIQRDYVKTTAAVRKRALTKKVPPKVKNLPKGDTVLFG